MNNKIKLQYIWVYILSIVFIMGVSFSSHAADCSHVWADKYDSSNHWKYCTQCGVTKDKKTHTFTDHWYMSGAHCRAGNYSVRTCDCGYSYKYDEPCDFNSTWHDTGNRCIHYRICKKCGDWAGSERCADSDGPLGCGNSGYCTKCGVYISSGVHSLRCYDNELKCEWCNKKFGDIVNKKQEYNSSHTKCTYSFRINKTYSGLRWCGTGMYTSRGNSNQSGRYSNSSNYIDITLTFNITNHTYDSTYSFDDLNATVDGTKCHVGSFGITIHSDWNAPTITDIKQTPQKEYLGWVTINQLEIKGRENEQDIVYITILDSNGNKIVSNAAAPVSGNQYSYTCTPPLEGATAGRSYTLKVKDYVGNETSQTFTIKKTDCKAPEIVSNTKYDQWSGTKTVILQIKDYGYGYDNGTGSVKVSLNNESNYKNATLSSKGVYTVTYTFPNETSTLNTYNVYLKDGLENKECVKIQVGYIDNTKPAINSLPITYLSGNNGATIKVSASDARSGVYQYGYKFSSDSNITWQTSNTLTLKKYGTYTIYVKDKAGNIQNKALTIGYIVTYDAAGGSSTKTTDTATLSVKLANASRTGYTFDGWYDSNKNVGKSGSTYTPGKNVTLKAHWTPIVYKISYITYGGQNAWNPVTYTIETPTFTLKKPTLNGFTFIGWTDLNSGEPKDSYIISKGSIGDRLISANWVSGTISDNSLNNRDGNGNSDSNRRNISDPNDARSKNTKTQHNKINLAS